MKPYGYKMVVVALLSIHCQSLVNIAFVKALMKASLYVWDVQHGEDQWLVVLTQPHHKYYD